MYWLMKSEPGECSFEYVCGLPEHKVSWWGIRNYQARNFMRDKMTVGDGVLFYHSSCAEPGIAGIAEIASETYPDSLQFDPASEYFDAKSTHEKAAVARAGRESRHTYRPDSALRLKSHPGT